MGLIIDGDKLMMGLSDWWYSSFGQEETEEAKAIRKVIDKVEEGLNAYKVDVPSVQPKQPDSGSITCINSENMRDRTTDGLISRQAAIDKLNGIPALASHPNLKLLCLEWIGSVPSAQPERKKGEWIELFFDDPATFPPVDDDGYSNHILLSFANYTLPCIGLYKTDDDGGAFYEGDSDEPLTKFGLFVNAWQPLAKPYRRD